MTPQSLSERVSVRVCKRVRFLQHAGKEIARRVQFDPTGTILAVGYHTQAKLWNVSSTQLIANLTRHSDVDRLVLFGTYWHAIQIVMSPDGKLLLTIGDKSIKVWNTVTGDPVATLNGVHASCIFFRQQGNSSNW